MLQIRFTDDFYEAQALRDKGFEPIECAFGQLGSVLGPLAMDHHGEESYREGVALRACRDHYGARRDDPRFVVTGTPDADAVLAILALSGQVPQGHLSSRFYELVDRQDVDPIGLDLLSTPEGEELVWFNQREGNTQSRAGFLRALGEMKHLLMEGLSEQERTHLRGAERRRQRLAQEGIIHCLDIEGKRCPPKRHAEALRGAAIKQTTARILVVHSRVWGFDLWYRIAPVVVSYAARMAKVTVGCPDEETAAQLFGPGGLQAVWPSLGQGWGGRETIGGSPRGERLKLSSAASTAQRLLSLLKKVAPS